MTALTACGSSEEVCSHLVSRTLTDKRDRKRISKIYRKAFSRKVKIWGGAGLQRENTGRGLVWSEQHHISNMMRTESSLSQTVPPLSEEWHFQLFGQ